MSITTSVASVAKILMAPFVPAGTIAALDLTRPSIEFSVPVLGAADVRADALKETVPFPVPLEPEPIVIQSALLTAVHAQLEEVVTLTDRLPPAPFNAALEALRV